MSARGFAALSPERRREIAQQGGRAAHVAGTAHRWTTDEAREVGRRGGQTTGANREHMSRIGSLGGRKVSEDVGHMATIGRKGGEAVSADREHMQEIGRVGGRSHGSVVWPTELGDPDEPRAQPVR